MFSLGSFAAGHLGISSSRHVNFELAVFDLDPRPGYLCNLKTMTLNNTLFFSTRGQVFKRAITFASAVSILDTFVCAAPEVLDFFQEIFLSAVSHDFFIFCFSVI